MNARRTVKYDTRTDQTSLVGYDFERFDLDKWLSGALTPDGVIYYSIPANANQILAIDPIGEFLATTKAIMQERPEEFGSLFQPIQADEDFVKSSSFTNFDLAVVKI